MTELRLFILSAVVAADGDYPVRQRAQNAEIDEGITLMRLFALRSQADRMSDVMKQASPAESC